MKAHGLILHCLLILALACNGLANGMAMPAMAAQPDQGAIKAESMADTAAPCHSRHSQTPLVTEEVATTPSDKSIPDCCKNTQCQCPCNMHLSLVAISLLVAESLRYLPQPMSMRDDPILGASHVPLLRPPIA
ncbi:MAG: CopL family metal-binding regulatory protein [Arenimonas sp.]|jgi:hypothetical protein